MCRVDKYLLISFLSVSLLGAIGAIIFIVRHYFRYTRHCTEQTEATVTPMGRAMGTVTSLLRFSYEGVVYEVKVTNPRCEGKDRVTVCFDPNRPRSLFLNFGDNDAKAFLRIHRLMGAVFSVAGIFMLVMMVLFALDILPLRAI